MPLYEFKCQECGHGYERIERVSSPQDGVCPKCHGSAHRLIGAPALQFKGSGWYVNDYGKGQSSGSHPTESTNPPSKAKGSDDATKSANKTEKKADTKVA